MALSTSHHRHGPAHDTPALGYFGTGCQYLWTIDNGRITMREKLLSHVTRIILVGVFGPGLLFTLWSHTAEFRDEPGFLKIIIVLTIGFMSIVFLRYASDLILNKRLVLEPKLGRIRLSGGTMRSFDEINVSPDLLLYREQRQFYTDKDSYTNHLLQAQKDGKDIILLATDDALHFEKICSMLRQNGFTILAPGEKPINDSFADGFK